VSYVLGKGRAEAMANELVIAGEFLRGIRDIIVTRASAFWVKRIETESDRFRHLYARDLVWHGTPGVLIETSFFVGVTLLVAFNHGRDENLPGQMLPVLVVYFYALYRLVGAVNVFIRHKLRISSLMPDVVLLYDTIQTM